MSYSHHRLTNPSQILPFKQEMGEKQFFEYAIGVYKYIADMETGEQFDITKRVSEKNRDKFIKIACLYIADYQDAIFNESFTKITKL